MKKRMHMLLALTIAIVLMLPVTGFAEGEIVDQSCEPTGTWYSSSTIIFGMPMGQSFTPSKSPLAGVEVYLTTANLAGDDTITMNIREGDIYGTILASKTQTVPQTYIDWEGWVYFGLPGELTVTPGTPYVWELIVTNSTFAYCSTSADQYANGTLLSSGLARANEDAYFRTYTYPEPSAPVVTAQPVDQQALQGQSISFTAAASGFPAPSVQWQRSTDGAIFTDIEGAVLPTYSVAAGIEDSNTYYRAIFTNDTGTATTDSATLRVIPKRYDRYYQVIEKDMPLTWSQAKRAASSMKAKVGGVTYIGHLVTITTNEEYVYINELPGIDVQAFIGATKTKKGWTWVTGELWNEAGTHWASTEPSAGDAYVVNNGGEWDAVSKSYTLNAYIVEYEVKGTRY